jgi:hypothetical protein
MPKGLGRPAIWSPKPRGTWAGERRTRTGLHPACVAGEAVERAGFAQAFHNHLDRAGGEGGGQFGVALCRAGEAEPVGRPSLGRGGGEFAPEEMSSVATRSRSQDRSAGLGLALTA